MLNDFTWIVVVGALFMFLMGFGIGANDVANNFGSSVGSGAIRLPWAILIAAIAEFVGAVAFGSTVTESVRKGVVDFAVFEDRPEVLMFGNLCALLSASFCLITATKFGTPISTTHTIVGALVGFALATGQADAVKWPYVGTLVASWVLSPIMAGFTGALLFWVTRKFILRGHDPVKLGFRYMWIMVFLLFASFCLFFTFKNPIVLTGVSCTVIKDGVTKSINPCKVSSWVDTHPGIAVAIGLSSAVLFTIVIGPIAYWVARRSIEEYDQQTRLKIQREIEMASAGKIESTDNSVELVTGDDVADSMSSAWNKDDIRLGVAAAEQGVEIGVQEKKPGGKRGGAAKRFPRYVVNKDSREDDDNLSTDAGDGYSDSSRRRLCGESSGSAKLWQKMPWNQDLTQDVMRDSKETAEMHERAEVFDPRAEKFFSFLQIISAVTSCVIHGANDVANATAPFASIWDIYCNGKFNHSVAVPTWILLIGGSSIAIGLAIFGANVIKTIGMKLTKITPSRGFSIEIGMTLTMLLGTNLGLPLSTTQSQVGSTVGVGLIDKQTDSSKQSNSFFGSFGLNTSAVNFRLLVKVFSAWIVALVSAAVVAAAVFAFALYSPSFVNNPLPG